MYLISLGVIWEQAMGKWRKILKVTSRFLDQYYLGWRIQLSSFKNLGVCYVSISFIDLRSPSELYNS